MYFASSVVDVSAEAPDEGSPAPEGASRLPQTQITSPFLLTIGLRVRVLPAMLLFAWIPKVAARVPVSMSTDDTYLPVFDEAPPEMPSCTSEDGHAPSCAYHSATPA